MRDVRLSSPAHSQAGFALTNTQMVLAAVAGTVVLAAALIAIGAPGSRRAAGQSDMSEQAVAMRLQPVGSVEVKAAAAGGQTRTGEQLFQTACGACHSAGTLGAPKLGDAAAWGPRVKTGFDALMASATKGKNSMPARGGSDASDFELARAVVYMANKGGASFPEPKAPAAAASAAQ
jgi:cytochrome c5